MSAMIMYWTTSGLLSWTHQVVQTPQAVTVQEWQEVCVISFHKLRKRQPISSRRDRKCRTYLRWGNIFFVNFRMESRGLRFLFHGIVKELLAFITHYVTFTQISHKSFGQKLPKSLIFRKRSSFTSLDAFKIVTHEYCLSLDDMLQNLK